jgi:PDZ domain-containing protein
VDTIESMVAPAPSDSEAAPFSWMVRRYWWLMTPIVFMAFVVPLLLAVTVPYFAITPGDARRIDDLIKAPPDKTFPPEGRILLATVGISNGRISVFEAVRGWLDRDTDVVQEKKILGRTPRDKFTQLNLQDMDQSKQKAEALALRRLGYTVGESGSGVLVVTVEPGLPGVGHFHQGDVITAIDKKPTLLTETMHAILAAHKPGDTVHFTVTDPKGQTRDEPVTLAARKDGTAVVGVTIVTKDFKFNLPFDVHIDSADIGGPSAGLSFTTALIDELSPGELTGGHKVAMTGTIDLDGTVGPVGGVAQKTVAVRKAGAEYFLVPPLEYKEALSRAGPHLHVVQVSTLDEALAALGRIGGDISVVKPLPK